MACLAENWKCHSGRLKLLMLYGWYCEIDCLGMNSLPSWDILTLAFKLDSFQLADRIRRCLFISHDSMSCGQMLNEKACEWPVSICFSGACWLAWFHWARMSNLGHCGCVYSGVWTDCTINTMAASYTKWNGEKSRRLGIAFLILICEYGEKNLLMGTPAPTPSPRSSASSSLAQASSSHFALFTPLLFLCSWRGGRHVQGHPKPVSGKMKWIIKPSSSKCALMQTYRLPENVEIRPCCLVILFMWQNCIVHGIFLGVNVFISSCKVIWYVCIVIFKSIKLLAWHFTIPELISHTANTQLAAGKRELWKTISSGQCNCGEAKAQFVCERDADAVLVTLCQILPAYSIAKCVPAWIPYKVASNCICLVSRLCIRVPV